MWEFQIVNNETGETTAIFGYSWSDAVERSGIKVNEWTYLSRDYID